MLHVFYSDLVELPLPEKHAFPRDKYRLAREWVERLAALPGNPLEIALAPAPAVTRRELLRVHTADYIDAVFEGRLTDKQQRAIGFPWSRGFVRRQLHSTGGTLAAARVALELDSPAWGAHLAGGTHHAFADHGQGFCVFNDVAVAIRTLRAEGALERALVVDCDVHQGNGTADLFKDDPQVFTFSIHGAKNFPFHKTTSDLDVPLEDGCEDAAYLELLDPALARIFDGDYDAVFYISGADPFEEDKYGRMKLTKAGLRERDRRVLSRCREAALPTVIVMGGGYARDVDDIAEIYAATIETAAEQALV